MKNLGGLIVLLSAFIFVGAVVTVAYVFATRHQHLTVPDTLPSDPVKREVLFEQMHTTFRIGLVLGLGAVLVLLIGLATLGTSYLQNKAKPPAIASGQEIRGQDSTGGEANGNVGSSGSTRASQPMH